MTRLPEGETESHVRSPLVPDALTEKLTLRAALTARYAWTDVVLPAVAANENEVGEMVRALPPSPASADEVQNAAATKIANAKSAHRRFTQMLLAD